MNNQWLPCVGRWYLWRGRPVKIRDVELRTSQDKELGLARVSIVVWTEQHGGVMYGAEEDWRAV